jgi:threonine/homoserine/homoserine lactone efflux protein
MEVKSLILFFLTVFPLICTPGPDILFTASQGISKGRLAALRAVGGVLLGYSAHAILSAFGIAVLVSASPFLFSALKWFGVVYFIFLAAQILYSACQRKKRIILDEHEAETISLWKGFFTSFLNPKGLLMYLAILPQFISPDGNTAIQALVLSALFILGCGLVYSIVGILAAKAHGRSISDSARRRFEAIAGLMLTAATVKIVMQVK